MKNLKLGDHVNWESQAGGSTKKKSGTVHYIVPKGSAATDRFHVEKYNPGYYPKHKQMFDGTIPRDHESYVIIVPSKSGRGKCKLYWPHVSKLQVQ